MKPIGPYVAARELPGRDVAGTVVGPLIGPATVRTLRATDRLTGMPVLVHVLPSALPVPQLPDHPALLPYSDEGMDGDDAYLVTELPLHAVLAADPVLAARGALAGLAALHGAGLVHGGVSASQLWSVDGRVALAGAGLPWSKEPGSPEDDLRALADALAVLGGLPESLRALQDSPGKLTAQAALARLPAGAGAGSSRNSTQAEPTGSAAPVQTLPAEAVQIGAKPAEEAAPLPTPPAAPHNGTPIILGESWPDPADANTSAATPAAPHPSGPDAPWGKVELAVVDVAFTHLPEVPARVADPVTAEDVRASSEPRSAAEPAVQSPSQQVLSPVDAKQPEPDQADLSAPAVIQIDLTQPGAAHPNTVQPSTDAPDDAAVTAPAVTITAVRPPIQPESSTLPAVSPVSAYSNAPPGVAETPQERRKRQNDERRAQAMQDSRAAAERKAAARREQEAAQPAVVQIEFDDLPELPVEDSEAPQTVGMRFPASVNVERVPASMRRAPLPPEPADQEDSEQPDQRSALGESAGQEARKTQEVGRLPARRTQGEPIRIGWAEDDSWRVVKAPGKAAPARRAATAPRWLLPFLAALLLIGGAVWAYFALPAVNTPAAASGPCCTVRFTVQGAAGVTARLTVLEAPDGANLTPGQDVGVAPGPINLPVRGTYRLRVAADGYAPGTLSVTAPTSQPVRIDLGP